MNQTFNKHTNNKVSFDLFVNPAKESRQKKSNYIYNNKITYKDMITGGDNRSHYSKHHHNTIFNNYNNYSSMAKCSSMTKLTKTQSNSYLSSKSFMTTLQERRTSPFQSSISHTISKNCNEKSISTMQSTDERKELSRTKSELKEKNDIIKTLHKTIDTHIKEKSNMNEEMMDMKMKLAELKLENSRMKQENKSLQFAYQKIKEDNGKLVAKEIKLAEIMSILGKDERLVSKYAEEDIGSKEGEQSLSGICFTDKIKMESKMQSIDTHYHHQLPALDFGGLYNELG